MKCLAMLLVLAAVSAGVFVKEAQAGGIHSGGGNGVATYRAGAPHTNENLIKVESWALFKARRAGTLSLPTETKSSAQEPEIYFAKLVRDLNRALSAASPDFYLWFERGDQAFAEALAKSLRRYELSKELSESPLTAEMDLVDDFGRRVTLDENQSLVQIVKREGDQFDINISFWKRMDALDRFDIRNHEAAYAVSWHDDSVRIQDLQLYLIDHVLKGTPIDRAEFERRAVSEWNLFQVQFPNGTASAKQLIPGLRIGDGSDRPYSGSGSTTEHQGILPPGVPLSSSEDLHCGMATDWMSVGVSKEIEILYLDGSKSQKSKKTLSDVEFAYVQQLKKLSGPAILSQLNPMKTPFLYDYMPVMCFKKRFPLFGALGDLLYVEFRKAYDVDKAKSSWEKSQSRANQEYESVIARSLSKKIDAALDYDGNKKTKESEVKEKARSLEGLVLSFNLGEIQTESLILDIRYKVKFIAKFRMEHDYSRSDPDRYAWPALLLESVSDIGRISAGQLSRYALSNPGIRPPPFVLYPGGRGSAIVPTAEKITIVGRLSAYVETTSK